MCRCYGGREASGRQRLPSLAESTSRATRCDTPRHSGDQSLCSGRKALLRSSHGAGRHGQSDTQFGVYRTRWPRPLITCLCLYVCQRRSMPSVPMVGAQRHKARLSRVCLWKQRASGDPASTPSPSQPPSLSSVPHIPSVFPSQD